MKLKELFAEDYAARPSDGTRNHPTNLPTFDPAYSKVVGTFDAVDIWGSREKKGCESFGIKDGDRVVAYLIISENDVRPHTQQFHEIWVAESHLRRGYASALVLFVLKKLHVKLFCAHDDIVSGDARNLLKALATAGKIKLLNASDEQPVDSSALNDLKKNDLELVIESWRSRWELFANDATSLVEQVSVIEQGKEYY